IVSCLIIDDYDSSVDIIFNDNNNLIQKYFNYAFKGLLRWDAFYFLHISEEGYIYEQEFAFFPLLPLLARILGDFAFIPLGYFLTYTQVLFLSGVLITNICFVLASINLYKLSLILFKDEKFAFISSIFYILTPSCIFMTSMYTESLFGFLSFFGMRLFYENKLFFASLIWCLASFTRSNGIVYIGFYVYEVIKDYFNINGNNGVSNSVGGIVSCLIIDDYDSSVDIIFNDNNNLIQKYFNYAFKGLLRWDAFYFLHISEEGYIYEQEFAFFPLLPLLARILGDFASFTRSNGIVYIGFYVYEVIKDYFNINGNNGVSNSVGGTFKIIFYYIKIILLGLISISGFIIFQTYGYYQYCTDNSLEREWCNSYLIYSFVQSYYWNCGFFKYYEFKQIPNFLLAMPMISLSVYGIFTYIKYDINRIFTLGLTKKKSVKEGK
ncbi:7953_t:CDS:2, partial [Entrophospora sp. SA101]